MDKNGFIYKHLQIYQFSRFSVKNLLIWAYTFSAITEPFLSNFEKQRCMYLLWRLILWNEQQKSFIFYEPLIPLRKTWFIAHISLIYLTRKKCLCDYTI